MSTSVLMAKVPPIPPRFLYPPLSNPVISSTCYSLVIVRSTVGAVKDQSWMVVDVGSDW